MTPRNNSTIREIFKYLSVKQCVINGLSPLKELLQTGESHKNLDLAVGNLLHQRHGAIALAGAGQVRNSPTRRARP